MKSVFFVVLVVVFTACQTIKIKEDTYKISTTSPELGSIGEYSAGFQGQSDFQTRTLPVLENKIRLSIEMVPYNKKLNKVYQSKTKYNQNQVKLAYIDSLPSKPEITILKILDITGLVTELNASYNTAAYKVINDLEKSEIVTSVAVQFSAAEMAKIRQADACYLTNNQEKKYSVSLYKLGKKIENIEINSENIVAYQVGKFCWSEDTRAKWTIADIVSSGSSCKGRTSRKVQEKKKEDNLFKM
jgi:hypothetical protein